jgi:thiamine biosynthesis lipoprotein
VKFRFAAAVLAFAVSAAPAFAAVQRARYLMGTVCEIAVPEGHEPAIEAAFAEAARIESMLSTWIETSELSRVNRGEATPSGELEMVLTAADAWSRRTGGAFDPRVGELVRVWRTREEGALPQRDAIVRALHGRTIEEGAFGKGYAIDRMLAGIDLPEAMINFGGQIAVRGKLRVTIADPTDRDRPALALTLHDASLSTSSGSEKTFVVGDRRFSHIIDPRNGEALPPRGSVSVIADDAFSADILSTALYVLGEDDGLRWADVNGIAVIYIDADGHVRRSAQARERVRDLEPLDPKFDLKD